MDRFFDGLAIYLGIIVGLIHPPENLRVEAQMIQDRTGVILEVMTVGAWTPEVESFLLAGNTLTQELQVTWGDRQWRQERSLSYEAWKNIFVLTGTFGGVKNIEKIQEKEHAKKSWMRFHQIDLGHQDELEINLNKPMEISVNLAQDPQQKGRYKALWGYQTPSKTLLYTTWLEVPR